MRSFLFNALFNFLHHMESGGTHYLINCNCRTKIKRDGSSVMLQQLEWWMGCKCEDYIVRRSDWWISSFCHESILKCNHCFIGDVFHSSPSRSRNVTVEESRYCSQALLHKIKNKNNNRKTTATQFPVWNSIEFVYQACCNLWQMLLLCPP